MVFDEEHKNKVGKALTLRIADALENRELKEQDLPVIAEDVLDGINKVKTHEELVDFLKELSKNWPFFSTVLTLEKGEVLEEKTNEKTEQIANLIKENKLDDALNIAQSVLNK